MSRVRPQRLHHAAIRIRDIGESRRFYEGLLGLERAERPDMGFAGEWYAIGDAQLHLIQIPKQGEGLDPTDPHFAFEVDDLPAAKSALDEAGLPYLEFGKVLWVRDPDGYTVELRARGAFP